MSKISVLLTSVVGLILFLSVPSLAANAGSAAIDPTADWLGVIGDSATTGAASDLNLQPNLQTLMGILIEYAADPNLTDVQPSLEGHPLQNIVPQFTPQLAPPTRVFYTETEMQQASANGNGASLEDGMKAGLRVDIEENSFGYQYGIQKGLPADQIVFAGQDGSRVDAIPQQIARLFAKPAQTLPPVVLVSFNANDFCDGEIFSEDITARTAIFAKDLRDAWEKSAEMMLPHPNGTRFVILSPIEVANVLTNPDLLSQQVNFEGQGGMTCRELRETDFAAKRAEMNEESDLLKRASNLPQLAQLEAQVKVQQALVGMCAAVLGTRPDDQERLQFLGQIQSEFRNVWREEIAALNKQYEGQNLSWSFIESVADIRFTKGDAANDCFHPSALGHAKITEELLKLVPKF